jgi:cobalt-precorrin 5A hydrolase
MSDLVIGVGMQQGVDTAAILDAIRDAIGGERIECLATIDKRAAECGLIRAAESLGVEIVSFTAAELALVAIPNPSSRVARALDTASVAEAAAILAAHGGELIVPKCVSRGVVVAAARRVRQRTQPLP